MSSRYTFFVRARRDQNTEHWDVRLDAALRVIETGRSS
jgi:hypothetical protein